MNTATGKNIFVHCWVNSTTYNDYKRLRKSKPFFLLGNNMNICVISGSTLGGAEYVAEHLEEVLKTQDFLPHFSTDQNLMM